MAYTPNATSPAATIVTGRASIDSQTDRVLISVDPKRAGQVFFGGTWGDVETYVACLLQRYQFLN